MHSLIFISIRSRQSVSRALVSERLMKGMNAIFLLVYNWSL